MKESEDESTLHQISTSIHEEDVHHYSLLEEGFQLRGHPLISYVAVKVQIMAADGNTT